MPCQGAQRSTCRKFGCKCASERRNELSSYAHRRYGCYYLTKPFANAELLARIRVWLRQTARVAPDSDESLIEVGELRIDLGRRLVWAAGREVHLTPIEYKLFATLMRNSGRVLTHRQLLEMTWGPRYGSETQYLRVYMGQLRRKLEPDATLPRYLLTEPGVGYRLRAE